MKPHDSNTAEAAEAAERLREAAARYGLETRFTVEDGMLDPALVAEVPVDWAREHRLLPVRLGGEVCVLCADPGDIDGPNDLALLIGCDPRPVAAPEAVILEAIERCYFSRDSSPGAFIRDLGTAEARATAVRRGDDLLQVAEQAPVTQLVNLILLEAVKRRASDIHFEPFEDRLLVRYRIDGVLYEQTSPPKAMEDALVSRLKVMARMDIAERRLPQDGMARVRVGEREIDVRVSTVPVAEGERVVLRLLDRASALLPLDALGMARETLEGFRRLTSVSNGIVAVSGPTGSGKTTTLYAALMQLDAARRNILTVEDPIEYQLRGIGQIQVKPKIGLTFAEGLRHILRQDPDIILVGETRDPETAEIAVRASLTGHLVLTTLHTNDAPGAVLRLLDIGVEPYLLASCLRGVLAQRLVRRLCARCRRESRATEQELEALGARAERVRERTVWRAGAGCEACLEGYSGRTGLFELMSVDAALTELIRTGTAGPGELKRAAVAAGMTSLQGEGVNKALAGETSLAEVIAAAG
ncbi:MAG: Flp pilus assembly complex ATPase component TadA [Lentisphaerae bacterium]|nr:Flp pilus assembly complex ATPase component TadA [Lentisphaerota bacterium]